MAICKSLLLASVAAMAVGSAFGATAARLPGSAVEQVPLAVLESEQARLREIDVAMAPIKSAGDLSDYLHTAGPESPLMALTPGSRERFVASLQFNENGLVSYRYEELGRELTASQAYRVLALFGAQRTTYLLRARVESPADVAASDPPRIPLMMTDHMDYRCLSPHNCFKTPLFICLTGC